MSSTSGFPLFSSVASWPSLYATVVCRSSPWCPMTLPTAFLCAAMVLVWKARPAAAGPGRTFTPAVRGTRSAQEPPNPSPTTSAVPPRPTALTRWTNPLIAPSQTRLCSITPDISAVWTTRRASGPTARRTPLAVPTECRTTAGTPS